MLYLKRVPLPPSGKKIEVWKKEIALICLFSLTVSDVHKPNFFVW